MQFLIIHGSYGSPDGNWFPQLKENLEALGQKVITPQFPVDSWDEVTKFGISTPTKQQTLINWLSAFNNILLQINRNDKLCIVAHSLGPLFTLHAVFNNNLKLDSAIFVSPFLSHLGCDWQIDHANGTFYKTDFDFEKLKQLIPLSYVLYSESDPYVKKKFPLEFAQKLDSSLIPVMNAGHMNSEVNLNEFPLVLELCKSRLDLSLYQKYKAHRSELFDVDYNRDSSEEVIYLDPKEVRDEGIFHFRNLKSSGFCTFFTGLDFWDTQSKYMYEGRLAAKRIKGLTRVFIVEKIEDLSKPQLLEQMTLDLEANIQVYLIMFNSILDQIPNPDFGIWDGEYRCIVRFNQEKKVDEVQLSSRKQDIQMAQKWQKLILNKATPIKKIPEDINKFIKTNTNK